MTIDTSGTVVLTKYGQGNKTGTAAYTLRVDSSGNIIEDPIGAGAVDGLGSTNYITRWQDSNTVTSSSIYELSNNIGIGTTVPAAKLQVVGGADVLNLAGSGSTSNTSIFSIDGNNGRLFEVSDDLSDSLFSVNTIAGLPVLEVFADNRIVAGAYNQNVLVISGSKVGIGTNAPIEALDVVGWARMDYGVVENAIYVGNSVNHWGDSDTNITFSDDQMTLNAGGVEFIRLYEAAGDTLVINEGGVDLDLRVEGDTDTNLIRTDAANNRVGIGTASPAAKFHILNSSEEILRLEGSGNTTAIHFFSGSNRTGIIGHSNGSSIAAAADAGDMVLRSESGKKVHIATNGSNARVTVDAVGNVGIGTTNPTYKLTTAGTIFVSGSTFGNPNTEGAYKLKFWDNGGTYNDTGIGIDGAGGGQEKIWFNALYGLSLIHI